MANARFDELLSQAVAEEGVQVVVLPRTGDQAERYRRLSPEVRVPSQAVDGRSLLAFSDIVVGAGGTMNREAAILGAPTYTVFAGRLAAVDSELVGQGLMVDLREGHAAPSWSHGTRGPDIGQASGRGRKILETVVHVLEEVGSR
jgi:predicted glycosyltransferase